MTPQRVLSSSEMKEMKEHRYWDGFNSYEEEDVAGWEEYDQDINDQIERAYQKYQAGSRSPFLDFRGVHFFS